MEALIAELNATYKAIDNELAEYSRKVNADDPAAWTHRVEADRLTERAHEITKALMRGGK